MGRATLRRPGRPSAEACRPGCSPARALSVHAVPWFGPGDALIERFGPESLTVHVQAPRILGASTHDILEHSVHHVVPAIPCYRLHAA
jgi:hypothetical protein